MVVTFVSLTLYAADKTPGYNYVIPSEIMTPDKVETSIGTLEFVDGMPTDATAQKAYDYLDTSRVVKAFLDAIPMASLEALRNGLAKFGASKSNQVVIFDQLMDSAPLFLTGNTDTVYVSVFLDLEKDGPTIVEVPPGSGPGTVNDAFFRFVTDMGAVGPDRAKGGKYLILPPDYEGDLKYKEGSATVEMEIEGKMETVYVSKSTTYTNWVIIRGFLVDGKPDASSKMFREGLKVYPLVKASNQPKMEFIAASHKSFNTIHANNEYFFKEINHVIQKEPIEFLDPELRGLLASIGIQKGHDFKPDKRMQKILKDGVAIANATARSLYFAPRHKQIYIYPDSQWKTAFAGGDYKWLINKGNGGRNLDARTSFFYIATVNTPAMVLKLIGKGSQYAIIDRDTKGEYFKGDQTYKLTIPPNVPAKNFWSVVVYDPQTRSELQTSQPYPSKNNKKEGLITNPDGSVDLYFGPKAPKGKEGNWIQTQPSKGWFTCLRLYGPTEAWFDKSWRPGEIEKIK